MQFNTKPLELALARRFAGSKKTWTDFFRKSMASFMKKVALLTPPGKATGADLEGRIPAGAFTQAKKAGEFAIDIDISRLFVTTLETIPEAKRTEAISDKRTNTQATRMKAILKKARNKWGRVRKNSIPVLVFKKDINALRRAQKRKVGFLAAGWNTAATAAGSSFVEWIKRHSNAGGVKYNVNTTTGACLFEAKNNTRFVTQMKALQFYINSAVGWEARNIMKQVAKHEASKTKVQ
jgi:hypothetical protein